MLLNRPRALEYMRRHGLDALVATSPANITYFTGFHWWLDKLFKEYMVAPGAASDPFQTYAVLPLEGRPALVVNPIYAINAADLPEQDLYTFGDSGMDRTLPPRGFNETNGRLMDLVNSPSRGATSTDALLSALADRGLVDGVIGFDMDGLVGEHRSKILDELTRASVRDCSNLLRMVRMVKTKEEIARLRGAAQIAEMAGMEALALARPGTRFADLKAHFRARVAEMGADFDHFIYSMRGLGISSEADYALGEDDVTYVDWGCVYRHYFSDTGTTLALKEPEGDMRDRHIAVVDSMEAGVQTLRPGALASEARDAMWAVLADRGVGTANPHGHGVGLEVRDYPILVADNGLRIKDDCVDVASDLPLEPNMVLNLETMIFMPDVGSVHNEQTFVITLDGCAPLVEQMRDRPVIPGY